MLHRRDILIGVCYVNSARKIARKVLSVDHKTVIFHTYHLDTGNSSGLPSECTIHDFRHWADHEASPAETASLKYHEMDALEHGVSD